MEKTQTAETEENIAPADAPTTEQPAGGMAGEAAPEGAAEDTQESAAEESGAQEDTQDGAAENGAQGTATEGSLRENVPEPFRPKSGFRYGCYRFVKRTFDIFSSFFMIVLLSWLILLCILIKWLEDFHNPIYVSKRVGKNGKIFRFYKIRTMCPNAEEMKKKLIDAGLNEADPPAFKMKNDPRITKVGKVYRKLSLDELPQLLNILNGSMSVVGPRPPIPSEVEQYTDLQLHRLDVKGGLLCLWQIQKNRNALSFDEWVRLDLEYIRKQSVRLDLKIIFKGAFMVVFDRSGE